MASTTHFSGSCFALRPSRLKGRNSSEPHSPRLQQHRRRSRTDPETLISTTQRDFAKLDASDLTWAEDPSHARLLCSFQTPTSHRTQTAAGKRKKHIMKSAVSKTTQSLLITLAFLCFGRLPKVEAVNPPPDGAYPNFTTAERQKALFSLTTGSANTAVGWYSLFSDAAGNFNPATGAGTLLFNTADNNTAFGAAALLFNTHWRRQHSQLRAGPL